MYFKKMRNKRAKYFSSLQSKVGGENELILYAKKKRREAMKGGRIIKTFSLKYTRT